MKIAIDGPSGAGKSTISKIVANELGFVYIDTGAMYRAVGLAALRAGLDTKNDVDQIIGLLGVIQISIKQTPNGQLIFLNGEDVSQEIRTPEASVAASNVAVIPQVRLKLVELQRELAGQTDVIMDGRDIGTYVLPDAQIKIFLTATVEDRANRRYLELKEKKIDTTYDAVLKDMKYRDQNDSSRSFAPLKPADDAVIMDTTGNTFEQSICQLLDFIKEKINQ